MSFADGCTRAYARHGTMAHLLEPGDQASAGSVALCGSHAPWLGTGSQDEYEKAAALPLCGRCARKAADRDPAATVITPEVSR